MTRPIRFTLFPENGRCSQPGCFRAPKLLGFCDIHHRHQVEAHHLAIRRADLHRPTPLCFPDKQSWVEYEVVAVDIQNKRPANPCADCSPEYQAKQIAEKKCQHPETVFLAGPGGTDVEGINSDDYTRWLDATMGRINRKVIGMPSAQARMQAVLKHEEDEAKQRP